MKAELYKDPSGEWRWRVTGRNGRIVGASSESFKRRKAAEKNIETLRNGLFRFTFKRPPVLS